MFVKEGKLSKTRRILEEIAAAFRDVCPQIYAEQLLMVRDVKAELAHDSAMSKGGSMMLRFSLHPTVHAFIKRHLGLDFFRSDENCDLLRRVWSDLAVGTHENKRPFHGIGDGTMHSTEKKSEAAKDSE